MEVLAEILRDPMTYCFGGACLAWVVADIWMRHKGIL